MKLRRRLPGQCLNMFKEDLKDRMNHPVVVPSLDINHQPL